MTTDDLTMEQRIAENTALLEDVDPAELMLEANDAVEPGDDIGEIVHRPDSESPFGIKLADVQSAGYKLVYHTQTREPSVVNGNLLAVQLSKTVEVRSEDGAVRRVRAFTTRAPDTWTPPAPPPDRGTLLCVFHKDAEMYEHYKKVGVFPMANRLGTCEKSNLVRAQDVLRHAERRHRDEWEAVEKDRTDAIAAEEREIRTLQAENLRAERAEREERNAVSVAAPQTPAQTVAEPASPVSSKTLDCDLCDFVSEASKAASRRNSVYRHKQAKHPEALFK